jgi:Tfp pilus assembly protein PilF
LDKALSLKPDLITARQQLGIAYYQRKDFVRAEQELKKGLSDDSAGTVHFILGMVYRRLGRPEESRLALEASRKIRSERLAEVKIETQAPTQ